MRRYYRRATPFQAICSASEVVTLDVCYGVKDVSKHDCYPWFKDNYGHLFPQLPERTPSLPPTAYATIPDRTLPGRARPDGHCRPLRH